MTYKKLCPLIAVYFSLTCPLFANPPCVSQEACLKDPDCFCWCSQICNWRKKTAEDHPVAIDNDPNGKFCYCKKWDYENFKANCINGEHIPEPAGAQ